jgi:hypothetical protein
VSHDVRLMVSVPSSRDWKPQFSMSFVGLANHLQRHGAGGRLKGINFQSTQQASILPNAREGFFRHALEGGFTHWLSLDDDMQFPADAFDRLLARNLPVVAANYCRKIPGQAMAVSAGLDLQIMTSQGRSGVEEIGRMALGLALVDMRVVKHVPAPRFEIRWDDSVQMCCSDDVYFSDKLRAHGVKIYVDHDLSQHVYHIGDFPFQFPQVQPDAVSLAAE